MKLNPTSCCGLKEIDGLSNHRTPEKAMNALCYELQKIEYNLALIVYTGVVKEKYGKRFTSYIRKHKLGRVTSSKSQMNPNSDNIIRGWLLNPNKRAIKKWATANYHEE